MTKDGVITIASRHDVLETVDRLAQAIAQRGLTLFARIDHGAGARENGFALRPTILVLFGHPKGGTPLMIDQQSIGLDLPFKVLVWQDEGGATWLSYNDPVWLAQRHGLSPATMQTVDALATGMRALLESAAT